MSNDFDRLALLMRVCGVTTADAARRCGVSRPLLSAVFHGHVPATASLAARLADLETALAVEAAPVVADLARIVRAAEVANHA